MPLAAAIVGGLGATGALGGAFIQSNAAQTAAQQQAATAQQALALQQALFGKAQTALQPYITAGQGALGPLSALLTPGPSQTQTLENLPGFKFLSEYGTMAATNQLAGMGLGGSKGPLAKAISDYNEGLAGTSFQTLVQQLQGFANMGSGAAGSLASAAGGAATTQGQTLGTLGAAQAAGTLGSANALAGGLTGATSSITSPLLLSSLLSNLNQGNLYNSTTFDPQHALTPLSSSFNPGIPGVSG